MNDEQVSTAGERAGAADQRVGTTDNQAGSRETHLVELVTADGVAAGVATVAEAHGFPGRLHRAFSVVLFDPYGRVLLQQRAAVKTRFPLLWANTCCGHPAPGETVPDAAGRRLAEELGVRGVGLTELGVFAYRAEDADTGRVEFEYDHVLAGRIDLDAALQPDPGEVADTRWQPVSDLLADLRANPEVYAPWLLEVVETALTSPTIKVIFQTS